MLKEALRERFLCHSVKAELHQWLHIQPNFVYVSILGKCNNVEENKVTRTVVIYFLLFV